MKVTPISEKRTTYLVYIGTVILKGRKRGYSYMEIEDATPADDRDRGTDQDITVINGKLTGKTWNFSKAIRPMSIGRVLKCVVDDDTLYGEGQEYAGIFHDQKQVAIWEANSAANSLELRTHQAQKRIDKISYLDRHLEILRMAYRQQPHNGKMAFLLHIVNKIQND
jgi:hypothetical protein